MRVYENILELIGNTPIIKINKLNSGCANILAKVEYFNPTGSIKDRTAYSLIVEAEKKGLIKPNISTIIEPTSGNTGIGLAMICAIKEYKLILTMPETMSKERQDILKAYGAQIVLTSSQLGMQGSIDRAISLSKEIDNSFIVSQFDNPDNIKVHYEKTAQEIYDDTNGLVDIIVAGIGTGGTISGIAKKLKELKKDVKIIGFEPLSSPLITQGFSSIHKIQGIGANFIPENFKKKFIDEIIAVSDIDAIDMTVKLAKEEGIFAGISSGASLYVANLLSQKYENKNKNIVAILPDTGMRYLSCGIF